MNSTTSLFAPTYQPIQHNSKQYQTSLGFTSGINLDCTKNTSILKDKNEEILSQNNVKKSTSILSNLYKIDDRCKFVYDIYDNFIAIKFK
jgi:hypothetical protein